MLYINALFLMIILAAIVLFIVDNVKKEDSEDGKIVELTQFNKIAGYVLIALIAVLEFMASGKYRAELIRTVLWQQWMPKLLRIMVRTDSELSCRHTYMPGAMVR